MRRTLYAVVLALAAGTVLAQDVFLRRAAAPGGTDHSSKMVSIYYLEESSNSTRADATASGNDLSDQLSSVAQSTAFSPEGSASAYFDESADRLFRLDSSVSSGFPAKDGVTGITALTWGCRIELDSVGATQRVFGKGNYWKIEVDASGFVHVALIVDPFDEMDVVSDSALSTGTQYDVYGVWESGTTGKMRLNGVDQTATDAPSGELGSTADDLWVGNQQFFGPNVDGRVDECWVSINDPPLSDTVLDEIRADCVDGDCS